MFKTFFGKIWTGIKATPKALVKFGKNTAITITGAVYFMVWAPIACLKFYAYLFKSFGEIVFSSIHNMLEKVKGFKASSATAEAV